MKILKKLILVPLFLSLFSFSNLVLNKNKVNNYAETEKILNVNKENIIHFNKQEKNEEKELNSDIEKEEFREKL
jgi:hypothetical protein